MKRKNVKLVTYVVSCVVVPSYGVMVVALPLVVALLYVCFQLLLDIVQELIFLLREIKAIETRKRQGGQKKGSCGRKD